MPLGVTPKLPLRSLGCQSKLKGYWATIPSAQLHEILAHAGFDFAIVDLEHGTFSFQDALETVQLLHGVGMYALIRPSSHDPKEILRCLELGVDGIMIPDVRSRSQAEQLLTSCLYPPHGTRGASGFTRATHYGSTDFPSHAAQSNDSLFISFLIESQEGLENAEEISSLLRLDCIYFGTYDLASSMEISNQAHAQVGALISDCIDAISRQGLTFGQVVVDENQLAQLDPRISFIPAGVDCGIVLRGARATVSMF